MRGGKRLFDTKQVELGATYGSISEGRVGKPSAETLLLQVVEPRRPLDVRQRVGFNPFQTLKLVPAHKYPFKIADEFFQMMLDASVKRHQFSVDVVDNLDLGLRLSEKHPCRTRKGST